MNWYENINIKNWYELNSWTFIGLLTYDKMIQVTESCVYLYILDGSDGKDPNKNRQRCMIGSLVYREFDKSHDQLLLIYLYDEIKSSRKRGIKYEQIFEEIRDKKIEEYLNQ